LDRLKTPIKKKKKKKRSAIELSSRHLNEAVN